MSAPQPMNKRLDEAVSGLRALRTLYRTFRCEEERSLYKQMATTLRLLLPGSSGDKGLVVTVMPSCTLHPLARPLSGPVPQGVQIPASAIVWPEDGLPWLNKPGPRLVFPGPRVLIGCNFKPDNWLFEGLIDYDVPRIPISIWLDTPILFDGMTVSKFIKLVGNKDAAHFDPDAQIERLNQNSRIQEALIAALADAVSSELLPPFEARQALSRPH